LSPQEAFQTAATKVDQAVATFAYDHWWISIRSVIMALLGFLLVAQFNSWAAKIDSISEIKIKLESNAVLFSDRVARNEHDIDKLEIRVGKLEGRH
jgi:hypothetical protein